MTEYVRVWAERRIGGIEARYARFRALEPYIMLKCAGVHNYVKVDINAAFVRALEYAHQGALCYCADGSVGPCWVCRGPRWEGWVSDEVVKLRKEAEYYKGKWLLVQTREPSQFARFAHMPYEFRKPSNVVFDSLYACANYARVVGGWCIRHDWLFKYGALTLIGNSVNTGRPWVFALAVTVTTNVLRHAVRNARVRVYAAYVDSVYAEDVVDMGVPAKVEDSGEVTLWHPGVYIGMRARGYWLIGQCRHSLGDWEAFRRAYRALGEDWIYEPAHRALLGAHTCVQWVERLRQYLKTLGVVWRGKQIMDKAYGKERFIGLPNY